MGGLGRAPAKPDRERIALGRQRAEDVVIELMKSTVEGLGGPGPHVPKEEDRLLEVGATEMEPLGRADVRELRLVPAGTQARDEPPVRQLIERRELFGED